MLSAAFLNNSDNLCLLFSLYPSSMVQNAIFFTFTAHRRPTGFFKYIIYAVLECVLPPLRTHCGEAPRPRFEPGTGDLEERTLTTRPCTSLPHLMRNYHLHCTFIFLLFSNNKYKHVF